MDYDPVKFLIIDDDEVSRMKMQRALKKSKIENPAIYATDGVEALEILRGDTDNEELAQPYIVTLDINMPLMDGHEFLAELRGDENLKNVVVFILTTSDNDFDIRSSYNQNVAGYLLKDQSEEKLLEKVCMLESFSNCIVLPRH